MANRFGNTCQMQDMNRAGAVLQGEISALIANRNVAQDTVASQSQVDEAFYSLESEVSRLGDGLNALERRLDQVLGGPMPELQPNPISPIFTAELPNRIKRLSEVLHTFNDQVNSVLERLAL